MDILLGLVGVVILTLLVNDIHVTVFVPRGRAGPITRRFYSLSWSVWKRIGKRLSDTRRRAWLAQLGPILVPMTVVIWGTLLVLSFALMFAPWAADFTISPPESSPVPNWALALYYSGYSAVTLGVGDVPPNGTLPRFMAVAEAGFGFALFTVSVTYLLSVYSARNQSTAFALTIARFIGRREGHDPTTLLVNIIRMESRETTSVWLQQLAFDLATLVQLMGQYSLLHFFHEPNDDRAVPIALSDLMELLTVSQALVDPEYAPALIDGASAEALRRLGRQYLVECRALAPDSQPTHEHQRRKKYEAARARLKAAGVPMRPTEDAWSIYNDSRSSWDDTDVHMRSWLGYNDEDSQDQPT